LLLSILLAFVSAIPKDPSLPLIADLTPEGLSLTSPDISLSQQEAVVLRVETSEPGSEVRIFAVVSISMV